MAYGTVHPTSTTHISSHPTETRKASHAREAGLPKSLSRVRTAHERLVVLVLVSAAQRDSEAVTCHAREYIHAKMTRVWGWGYRRKPSAVAASRADGLWACGCAERRC